MGILRSIFGPSKDEIWAQIAADIGGEFVEGGFWGKDVLRYKHGEWEILLDTYTVTSNTGTTTTSTTYTRMRAPFVNKDGLQFKIYPEGFFSSIGKMFGMQDIEIGDPFFDRKYIIKSNNEQKIKQLLADDTLKELINKLPRVHFEIRDDEGWFSKEFPDGVEQLYFQCVGVIKKTEQLMALFNLFSLTLMRLVEIDSAYLSDPEVDLK